MKKLLLSLLTVICTCAAAAFAAEQTVANFDNATDLNTANALGGISFNFNGGTGVWSDAHIYELPLGPTGKSLGIGWGGVTGTEKYAGGGTFFASGTTGTKDISAYNNISFFIRTSTDTAANMKLEVQVQDLITVGTNTVTNTGKVKLSDYVQTVPGQWQAVVIPLADFQRNNPALNLAKARGLVFSADGSNGLEYQAAGYFFVDDIKLSNQTHAPARTDIYSGGDTGVLNLDDARGDTLLWWDQAGSTIASNATQVAVSTVCSITWTQVPATAVNVYAGNAYYYAFKVRNNGNLADRIVFSTSTVSGTALPIAIYQDKDMDGSFTAGDEQWNDAMGLLPDSTYYFLLKVTVPAGTANGAVSQIRVTAKDNNGVGNNDSWPSSTNDDTLTADITATCQAPAITVAKTANGGNSANAKPGDTIAYSIAVNNTGSSAASNVQLIDVIPVNMTLSGTASGATTIEYFNGSTWSSSTANAQKIRWKWTSINASSTATATFSAKVK